MGVAITIKDVAMESGYAVSTVSRVLNNHPEVSEKARSRIMQVVNKRGFVPNPIARQLPKRKNQLVSMVVKGHGNLLFLDLVEKMESALFLKGYSMVVKYVSEEENEVESAKELSSATSSSGIFFLGASIENFRACFQMISVPCVAIACQATTLGFSNLSSVSSDDVAGASLVMDHLIARGHRNIGILGGNLERSLPSKLRYAGCLQRLLLGNIPFVENLQYQQSYYSLKSGYENMMELHHKFPGITAVFAMGDVVAMGAIRALRDLGLSIPEQISVVGFDGMEMGRYFQPRITTIHQQTDLLAKRSIDIMLDRILYKTVATHEIVPSGIVLGESVADIREHGEKRYE